MVFRFIQVFCLLLMFQTGVFAYLLNGDLNPATKKFYPYSTSYRKYADTHHWDTAVVVIGYNRPHYFKQVISALEKNKEARSLPFFFILDGGSASKQQEYEKIINASFIKNKFIIKRPENYGLHFNIISGLRFIFDWCNFSRIIHFEDDVVITPHYLGLMLKLDKWAHEYYDNIGAVQGFRPCRMTFEEKVQNRAIVSETPGLWLGYCLRKTVWDSIKDLVYTYEKRFLGRDFLNVNRIKNWMKTTINEGIKPVIKDIHPSRKWQAPFDKYFTQLPEMGVGQCGILTMSLYLRGYSRLTTLVNRAVTIGEIGANYKSDKWQHHFHDVKLDIIPDDQSLAKFVPQMKIVY